MVEKSDQFEARKREAERLVAHFLDDFSPPRGMDDKKLLSRIKFIADAFARKMPTTGNYAEQIDRVLMSIRDTHQSNTWPSQAVFVMAMPAGERKEFAQLQQFSMDDTERLEKLMTEGKPVPESAVWGRIANSLNVPRQTLDAYRKSSAASWQSTYGDGAMSLMRNKYGPEVELFFYAGRQAAE